ncbi:thioredoxin domain-containing protein [Mycobacterium hodleri]|uniref:DsbA family protein n=1 Tax=Mycolicibacterium hodleri TaxID=49897 RepID=UPI003558CD97|nr:thioredoxin domain-containing protein [Mycolicibacterium hodleri]
MGVTAVAIVAIVVAAVALLIGRSDTDGPDRASAEVSTPAVVRESSHRLNSPPGADVTFVEFLDFECEGCRAAYPVVEQLRADYGDRVEFVLRYFPLPGHVNAERAARAVEAAAQQGRLEAMYRTMYETQAQWGERRAPADDVFRGFAAELGLDLPAFDAAYADPATAQRIQVDVDDGMALGVQGTPTFFVNGDHVTPRSVDDLRNAIEKELR